MKRFSRVLAVIILASAAIAAFGQGPLGPPDFPIPAGTGSRIALGAVERLNANYIFPETAKKMEDAIRSRNANHEYDGFTASRALCEKLTADLQAVSHDKHIRVISSKDPLPKPRAPTEQDRERNRRQMAFNNFGVEKVERLPGNIGYLDFRGFMPADAASPTIAAAMNVLAHTDALIIDLRRNGGGDPETVAFLTSYLYGPKPVHLNDLYFRPADQTTEWWTKAEVPGVRFGPDKPVYILTARFTFSAAEEFTYNLKSLKRATIVGENTGGGAHPGGVENIDDHFGLFVPSGRAINPITKKNWEGEGVQPDVETQAPKALKTAHILALRGIIAKAQNADVKQRFEIVLKDLEKDLADLRN